MAAITVLLLLIFSIPEYSLQPISSTEIKDVDHEVEGGSKTSPVVFLTVSSLASSYPEERERCIELNWYDVPEEHNGNESCSLRLFTHDPTENINDYLVSVEAGNRTEGYYRTPVQLPKYSFSEENVSDECLGFWIACTRENQILAKSCFKAFPRWMQNMGSFIGNYSLTTLMIPGTHDSGSYADFSPRADTIFNRYLVTQDESVYNQLVYGIRYIDLRVSYERVNGVADRFWITHDIFRTKTPVKEVFSQVKRFLNATNEIVVMDFHRFVNGFNGWRSTARHRRLIRMLESELGDYMIPVSMTSWAKLNDLWEHGKRLYVGYAANSERRQNHFLFPAVRQLWADKDNAVDLFNYLNATVCSRQQGRLTAAMAELTPTTAGAILDRYGGLRKMADEINRNVTMWFRDLWSNCANIVASDFFLGNNIIATAIERNLKIFST